MTKKNGFSLVELAVVLVIVGLLLGMGAGLLGILIKQSKRKRTREIVDAAVESVIGYVQIHKCLPDNATFPTVVRTPNDVYGKPLIYIHPTNLTCGGGYCSRENAPLYVWLCKDAACNIKDEVKNVAFVILSGGENYNIQTGIQNSGGITYVKIYDPSLEVDDYGGDFNRVELYDDIVKWVTLTELQKKVGCYPLEIKTARVLPTAVEDTVYTVNFEASGGKEPYSWSEVGNVLSQIGLSLSSQGRIQGTIDVYNTTSTGELSNSVSICDPCNCTVTFTARVTDSVGDHKESNFGIPVRPKSLLIVTEHIPYGYENTSYKATFSAEGGVLPMNWNLTGNLPSGLSFDTSTATISGIPSTGSAGTYNIKVTVTDYCGNSYSRNYTLTINPVSGNNTGGGGGGGGCSAYYVRNSTRYNLYWGCRCRFSCYWGKNSVKTISSGSVSIYRRSFVFCLSYGRVTFSEVSSTDRDGDCKVRYVGFSSLIDE